MTPARLKRLLIASVDGKPVPEAGLTVWGWFCALNDTRTFNGMRPNPISFAEIEAYARLYRLPLDPRHIDLIRAVDKAFVLKVVTGSATDAPPPRRASQPLTAAAFDAVFGS